MPVITSSLLSRPFQWATLSLCLLALPATATDVRLFETGSLEKIVARHSGKPFIVAFWSIGCAHCPKELKALGMLKKAYPALEVVLVAADFPEDAGQTAVLARQHGLAYAEQWVFAESVPERLRHEIDPRWHGELPRTHFYDRQGGLLVMAGVVPEETLVRWVKVQMPSPRKGR